MLLFVLIYVISFLLIVSATSISEESKRGMLKSNVEGNIVAHIYNDVFSYEQHVLALRRLVFFPMYLLDALSTWEKPHLCDVKSVMYFPGCVVEDGGRFTVIWYDNYKIAKRVYRDICRAPFFPDYKKRKGFTCWATLEGDCVGYVPLSNMVNYDIRLTFAQFLELTNQTEEEYTHSEFVKYTGM